MEKKQLKRALKDRKLAGVCGGIAKYFGWDSTTTRIGYAALSLFTAFAGCLFYLILWYVMPLDNE